MIVSINQPAYLPWLGYFHRIAASDLHIVLDHVQFEKNSFVNRNRIRTATGTTWLTVPVLTKGKFKELPISELTINTTEDWQGKHWRTIQQNYGKAQHFAEHAGFFESVYTRTWTHLLPLCMEITAYLLQSFGISTPFRSSSEMSPAQTKSELVLELCKSVGADTYLSGILGKQYLDEASFRRAGIRVLYQDYKHPTYPQYRAAGFEPHLSAIDLLFNCGPESRSILLAGNEM